MCDKGPFYQIVKYMHTSQSLNAQWEESWYHCLFVKQLNLTKLFGQKNKSVLMFDKKASQ